MTYRYNLVRQTLFSGMLVMSYGKFIIVLSIQYIALVFFIIIFGLNSCRICYDTNEWELISKYSKRFVRAGVKLRKTTFDIWMEFAAKRGL